MDGHEPHEDGVGGASDAGADGRGKGPVRQPQGGGERVHQQRAALAQQVLVLPHATCDKIGTDMCNLPRLSATVVCGRKVKAVFGRFRWTTSNKNQHRYV